MDEKMREVLLTRWERAVKEKPQQTRIFGPPSWLVSEEWDGKEPFADAAIRVRKRYGLPASPQEAQ